MSTALSDNERSLLLDFLSQKAVLWDAINKFCEHQSRFMDSSAASELRQRHLEQAADYAAKSDVYSGLLAELTSFARTP